MANVRLTEFKRGGTYQLTCTYKSNGVDASSVAAIAITSQMRTTAGVLVEDFTVTKLTQSGATLGQYTLNATKAESVLWPRGDHEIDIKFDGEPSENTMIQPVTKGPTE